MVIVFGEYARGRKEKRKIALQEESQKGSSYGLRTSSLFSSLSSWKGCASGTCPCSFQEPEARAASRTKTLNRNALHLHGDGKRLKLEGGVHR